MRLTRQHCPDNIKLGSRANLFRPCWSSSYSRKQFKLEKKIFFLWKESEPNPYSIVLGRINLNLEIKKINAETSDRDRN